VVAEAIIRPMGQARRMGQSRILAPTEISGSGDMDEVDRLLAECYVLNDLTATNTPATNGINPWAPGNAAGIRRRVPVLIGGRQLSADFCESSGIQQMIRTRVTGATLGVIGSGGVMPTGWSIGSMVGMTTELVAYDNTSITLRFNGTVVSGTAPGVSWNYSPAGSFVTGDPYYGYTSAQKISGSATVDQAILFGSEHDADATTQLRAFVGSAVSLSDGAVKPVVFSGTCTHASCSRLTMSTRVGRWTASPGDVFTNYTVKFRVPMLEKAAFPSSWVPSDASAVTRGADSLSVAQPAAMRTILAIARPYGWTDITTGYNLFGAFGGVSRPVIRRSSAANLLFSHRDAAGLKDITAAHGGWTTTAHKSLAMTWDGVETAYVNGVYAGVSAAATLPWATDPSLAIGMDGALANHFNGAVLLLGWNRVLTAAELAVLHRQAFIPQPSF
jgi:hypothetical protein